MEKWKDLKEEIRTLEYKLSESRKNERVGKMIFFCGTAFFCIVYFSYLQKTEKLLNRANEAVASYEVSFIIIIVSDELPPTFQFPVKKLLSSQWFDPWASSWSGSLRNIHWASTLLKRLFSIYHFNLPEFVWQIRRGTVQPWSTQVCETSAPVGSPLTVYGFHSVANWKL